MAAPKNKDEFRSEVANAFAAILEEKGLEWRKEWHGQANGGTRPYNAVTKAHYNGINAFWLRFVALAKGFDDPRWATMVQIMDKNGYYHKDKWHLKAGSKATYVEYWYQWDTVERKALTWEQYHTEIKNGRPKDDFLLRSRYTAVFNGSQIEGMPELPKPKTVEAEARADELVRKISSGMGVPILNDGGDRAFYSPMEDRIHLPKGEDFESEYAYNSTALHELSHASGHSSRLNRQSLAYFGTEKYAYEELVAEMSAAFLGSELAMQPSEHHLENHKAYVQSWIQAIRKKPESLAKAIKEAQNAAAYMELKAGLITEKEYQDTIDGAVSVNEKAKAKTHQR